MEKDNFKQQKRNYIFAIILLSVFLLGSLIFNFIGGFDFENNVQYQTAIGDDYTIKLENLGAKSVAFALDGTTLPGDTIKQKIQIVMPDVQTQNIILRAKVTLNEKSIEIFGYNFWQFNESDGYYYFNSTMYQNQTLGFCDEIKLSDDLRLKSNIVYYVNVVIELFYSSGLNV